MKNFVRTTLLAATLAGVSFGAFATAVPNPPLPAQDPIVQHLKLTNDQITRIKKLHQQLETDVSQISMKGIKDGALIEVIKSGKWDDTAVKQQLAAFSNIEQQARYYRVKYYFDLSKVLTPEQRQQVQQDLAQALE
ncbi:Spy/CpxP family protein refolding chaperone [Salmonella enterica]|uniref:Spy/CpxP family protein refolding chaperone n=1 Tax=Salmonella enterica TaxID=28901 RepID=UPI0009B158AF|nr:Spy/CpxP family protein refolding chaperone [Salmonella enterica]EDT5171425.1 Spy/CpxP family protein refolding chaperone [Salmonella enterica subsp. enterica serovar Tudu]EAZ2863396.1 hypothetical protein [Salmonella enterica]EJG3479273.1 Spy/CpxP family protein refolding chaperone [Salmonella enterica]EKL8360912.1 Spy/CpxP family protein refolding chaperone [Salmonella enterica]EKL8373831.1 Spy/CpxP family protein refolding chaperone [Salmonella enterica]